MTLSEGIINFEFEKSNQNHSLNFSLYKSQIKSIFQKENETIFAIYKVKRLAKYDKTCKRILVISNLNVYCLFSKKIQCKNTINLSKISKIKITENRSSVALFTAKNGYLFISRSSGEIGKNLK